MPLPSYKEILDLFKKGAELEAQEKIMELRQVALDLKEENISLREQVKELERLRDIRGTVVWDKRFYRTVDGADREGPYCQRCWDVDQKLVRLQASKSRKVGGLDFINSWVCLECDKAVPRSDEDA